MDTQPLVSPLVRVETLDPLDTPSVPWIQRAAYKLTPVFALGGNAFLFIILYAVLSDWLHATFSVNWLDLLGMAVFGGGYFVPLLIRDRIRDRHPPQYRVVAQDSTFRVLVQEAYDKPWREHDGIEWLTMELTLPDRVHHGSPTVHTDLTSIARGGGASIIARNWSQAERITFTYSAYENSWRKTHTVSFDVLVDPSDDGMRAFSRWCEAMRGVITRAEGTYDRSVPADEVLTNLSTADLTFSPVLRHQETGGAYRINQPLFQTTFIEEKPVAVTTGVRVDAEAETQAQAAPPKAAEEPAHVAAPSHPQVVPRKRRRAASE